MAHIRLAFKGWRSIRCKHTAAPRSITFRYDGEGVNHTTLGSVKQSEPGWQELENWKLLKKAMEEKQEVYARVLAKSKGGFLLDVLGRVALLPFPLSGVQSHEGRRTPTS